MTINGDLNINASGNGYCLGIYTASNNQLDINGNVTMKGKDGSWGIDNHDTSMPDDMGHYSISGIYAGSDYSLQRGSLININGNVDLAVNGTGVLANGGFATVNINGGGTINIKKMKKLPIMLLMLNLLL